MKIRINKFSKVPLYVQIKDDILEAILNKELRHLDLMPTEKELCDALFLSRSVIRKAYDLLIQEGYVIRRQGQGTFVNHRFRFVGPMKEIFSFNHLAKKEILMMGFIEYDHLVYPFLNLKSGEMVYDIVYKLSIDDDPVSIQHVYFPFKYFPNVDQYVQTYDNLYTIVHHQYTYHIMQIFSEFNATQASDVDALYLKIPQKSAIHYVTSIVKDQDLKPLLFIKHTLPAEYVKFEEVVR